ncbi:MAG: alpha/beta hydrolase [Alphaproteobacteria bacterium]|nr:alpha/beta hydrolase [Alphaproteobacteria bacterium]
MDDPELQFLAVAGEAGERRIALRVLPPEKPGGAVVLWLIGLKSDMVSTKAEALAGWCHDKGYGLTRFDYSGHGQSSGCFEEATTSDWLEEADAVFCQKTDAAPVVLVGSSTGAHIALVLLQRLRAKDPEAAARVLGLVLIAPAWDVTELIWNNLSPAAQQEILQTGRHDQPSEYGEPYRISKKFIEDGRKNLLRDAPFDPGCPVLALQGLLDKSVPPAHTRALSSVLKGDWLEITEVSDAEHRLSRPEDLDKIYALIERVIATGESTS